MLQQVISTGHDLASESLCFDQTGNTVWATTNDGSIMTVRLLDQQVKLIGTGYHSPIGVIPGHDGLTLAVVEESGLIWLARRDPASRTHAQQVIELPGHALVARRHPDAGRLLVLVTQEAVGDLPGAPDPSIYSVDVRSGAMVAVASGLFHARTFVVDEERREIAVLALSPEGNRKVSVIGLDDGVVSFDLQGMPRFDTIVTSPMPSEHGIVGAYSDALGEGHMALLRFDGTLGPAVDLGRPITSMAYWGSLLLVASGQDIIAVEWNLDEGQLPIEAPLGPLYVNGYARLKVDLASMALTPYDVVFQVREGADAGIVSAGIEPANADGTQPIVLVAGFQPGEYHIEARRRTDATLLATRRFRVTACWPDEVIGPPIAVTGAHQPYRLMSWGGSGAGLEYIQPAPEVWRVAVVLVATKDRRWDGLEAGAMNDWREKVIGSGDSAKRFYEEVSYRNTPPAAGSSPGMTIELAGGRVLGPVNLEEGWGDVFEPKKGQDLSRGWLSKPTGKEILANAISSWMADQPDGAQVMSMADSIVIVVRSATDMPTTIGTAPPIPTQFVWGHASHADFWRKTATTFTQGSKPIVLMTNVYPAALPTPPILEHTLCHEIGHNLGLDDLYDAKGEYPQEINDRSPVDADLMASTRPLPHFSLANRMRLGWIKPTWLRRFDFSANPIGDTVTLYATEKLTKVGPPAGRTAGIEVPIEFGWSYLFELRRTQGGQIGDQQLNRLSASQFLVLGTDLRVRPGEPARPPILFLPKDVDGDGPVLDAAGDDYEDNDFTNSTRMHDFTVRVQTLGTPDADSAEVRVDYVAAHRPQLQITPAPGRGNFKSPDIDLIGPLGLLMPGVFKGAPNTIRVTVHNWGTLQANQVKAHVKWLPFTVSSGAWQALPDPPPFNVPATGSTSFEVIWNVPASVKVATDEANHFCVRVEIDRYIDPVHDAQNEIVVFDNWAQSNFDSVSVAFGSPSERIRTVATATNPLERSATYLLTADQSRDGYRLYVGHAWLRLSSGATHSFELAYESLAGDPIHGVDFEQNLEPITLQLNHVAVTSWLVPENTECDTPREWWGIGLDLRAGRRAWIEEVRRNGELITARVRGRRDDLTIDVTYGDVYMAAWPEENPERTVVTQGIILPGGEVRVLLSNATLQEIAQGSRVIAVLARPADAQYAKAISDIGPLH